MATPEVQPDADPGAFALEAAQPKSALGPVGAHALVGLAAGGAVWTLDHGPLATALGGAAASAAFLHAFLRQRGWLVAGELGLCVAAGRVFGSETAAAWLLACGSAGAGAAWVTRQGGREDDQFFIPPLAGAVGGCGGLVALGSGGPVGAWGLLLERAAAQQANFEAFLSLPENEALRRDLTELAGWETIGPRMGLISLASGVAFWALALWLAGRWARRRALGPSPIAASVAFFRVGPQYTFVLIAGLVFEILAVWSGEEGLRLIAYPLLAVSAAGFLVAYVGVVIYAMALRRAGRPAGGGWGFLALSLLALGLAFYIGPVVGLADVWLDFRRTRLMKLLCS